MDGNMVGKRRRDRVVRMWLEPREWIPETRMWAEFILSRDELACLLGHALPLTIQLGEAEKEHALFLSDLGEVTLVPDLGLRVACKARVHWPLLGIDLPIEVSSLTLVLIPTIEEGVDGGALVFRASIEHADFSALPALVDARIAAAINAKLAGSGTKLSWNFSKALTQRVRISRSLEPLESFAIRPAWAKIRITSDAIVYAASFHSALVRRGESPPADDAAVLALPALPAGQPEASASSESSGLLSRHLLTAGAFALGAGVAFLVLRRALRS
jgi:hypothetical protein